MVTVVSGTPSNSAADFFPIGIQRMVARDKRESLNLHKCVSCNLVKVSLRLSNFQFECIIKCHYIPRPGLAAANGLLIEAVWELFNSIKCYRGKVQPHATGIPTLSRYSSSHAIYSISFAALLCTLSFHKTVIMSLIIQTIGSFLHDLYKNPSD